ncbi:MAG: hypothetical protein J6K87_01855 [Clostridia bacterium]|nr:hypothetical protein [Clostridia bacterium]
MNLKKFKKSLVSIVLGSSLFLGNGGVICQQPRAWLTEKFFKTAGETYKDNSKMTKIINVFKFFSDLHNEPEYASALIFICMSSSLRLKGLTPLRESATPTELFQLLFANAMIAATINGPSIGSNFKKPDGSDVTITETYNLKLLCWCSERTIAPVTEILQEELELIFSGQQINDTQIETPKSYCLFCNPKIDTQLKYLLNSANKLLSE